MVYRSYSQAQKCGLGLVWLGFVVCVVASSLPYWYTAKVDLNTAVVGIKFELYAGVWVYCVEASASSSFIGSSAESTACTSAYHSPTYLGSSNSFDDNNEIYVVRALVVISNIMSFLIAIVPCCRSLPTKTIGHGVIVLISAGLAFAAVGLMATKSEHILNLPEESVDIGWALGVYCFGAALWFIAAIILMLAPVGVNENAGGVVYNNQGTTMAVVTTNQTSPPQQFGYPQYAGQPYGAPQYGVQPYGSPQYGVQPYGAPQYGEPSNEPTKGY